MSTDITNIISIFSKFLDPKVSKTEKFKTIDEIKRLPVYSYKFISRSDAKILKDLLNISNIEEVSRLNRDNPFENLKLFGKTKDPLEVTELQQEFERKVAIIKAENPDLENFIKKAIFISSIITNMVFDGSHLWVATSNSGTYRIPVFPLPIRAYILPPGVE